MPDSVPDHPLVRPDARSTYHPWASLIVAAGVLLLYVARFGYGYGVSDQDEFLPLLLSRLDPTLFATDPFVAAQSAGGGVRGWFVGLLFLLSRLVPVPAAVLVVYVVSHLGLGAAVYRLGALLTRDRAAAALGAVGALVLTPQWTLGGNDLAHSLLVPSMPAWALGLWGVVLVLADRPRWAAILFALATYLQALVGLQLAGLVGLAYLADAALDPGARAARLRRAALFGLAYALAAGVALAPLATGQLTPDTGAAPSLFYIMAAFRNPHHYLPHAFSLGSVARFALVAAAGGGAFVWLHRTGALAHGRRLALLLGGVALFALVGLAGTELVPTLLIAKLQLFKATVLAKTLFVVGLAGAVGRALPSVLRAPLVLPSKRPARAAVLVALLWALLLAAALPPGAPLRPRIAALSPADADLAAVADWARSETQPTDLFVLPPSVSSFRARARRGTAVNFKAFPFEPAEVRAWYERLTDFAPPPPGIAGRGVLAALDSAYAHRAPDALHDAARRHDVAYVVRRTPLYGDGFAPVHSSGAWTVYRVDPVR